jgi:hypothetical protein
MAWADGMSKVRTTKARCASPMVKPVEATLRLV